MWTAAIPSRLEAVHDVRVDATTYLSEAGIDEALDLVALLLSEVLSNAVRHGADPRRASIELGQDVVRVQVSDGNPDPPVVQPLDPERPNGNGMRIVDALSDRWGVERRPHGKVVWFEVAIR